MFYFGKNKFVKQRNDLDLVLRLFESASRQYIRVSNKINNKITCRKSHTRVTDL